MPAKTLTNRPPRILVLEGLSGAARCVSRSGGDPIIVSPRDLSALDEVLAGGRFDGMLLTGGGDVDPRLYGEKPHKQVYGVSETRDYGEWMALERAKELGVPVMGICRGSQLMAVHNGGALRQHLTGHRGNDHIVFGESGSRFRRIIKGERGYFVSLHHQVVKRTGNGWRVAARAADGVIEAIESKDGRCLGVQFHPEMDYGKNECSRRLFGWLVAESAKRAGLVKPTAMTAGNWRREQQPRSTVPVPKRRPAGQQLALSTQVPERRKVSPVKTSWLCPDCGMRFDRLRDREDHYHWFHGDPSLVGMEPPPGHPDWL